MKSANQFGGGRNVYRNVERKVLLSPCRILMKPATRRETSCHTNREDSSMSLVAFNFCYLTTVAVVAYTAAVAAVLFLLLQKKKKMWLGNK